MEAFHEYNPRVPRESFDPLHISSLILQVNCLMQTKSQPASQQPIRKPSVASIAVCFGVH